MRGRSAPDATPATSRTLGVLSIVVTSQATSTPFRPESRRMSIPKQTDIELPLLRALRELGGRAQPRDVYTVLERHFIELTEADKAERLESGGSRWQNRVQFARQNLVSQGLIDRS